MTSPTEQPGSPPAKQIFAEVCDLAPEQRSAALEARCAGDATLRQAVQTLLDAHDNLGRFLAGPTSDFGGETAPRQIGPYKLLQEIGEGGFGTVFMAEQEHPVRRRVALKLIKLGMDTRQVIARFEAERQALAMMDHPGIARVFDAGAAPDGRPYFVMELVRGMPITEYCDRQNLAIRQRIELFAQVCQAVQHAHQKGIIHRDIKPTNVLVSTPDDRPVVKVIDFGIAKATQSRLTEKTLFTEFRQLIGTPEYMSPEQASGTLDIDTRSDVYSLGVLLYELLTGTTPFDARELRSKAYAEIQRVIREVDPPKPSTRLSAMPDTIASVAAHRKLEPRKLNTLIRGDLDWIVMKCLEKDRARRYESAASLAADVMHHLSDEPVLAGPPSAGYRFRKFVRRNRGPVAASAVVLVVLIAGIIGTTIGLIGQSRQRAIAEQQRAVAQRQEAEARRQAAVAEAVSRFQTDMLGSADPDRMLGEKVTVVEAVRAAVRELDSGKLEDQPLVEAAVRDTIGMTLRHLGRYDESEPVLRRSLEIRRVTLPAGHPDISISLEHLGQLLRVQGRFDEAETTLRQSLEIRRAALPAGAPEIAESLNGLALMLQEAGKFDGVEPMLLEALSIRRAALHPDDNRIPESLNNLATLYQRTGRQREAEPLLRETLESARRLFPPGHPLIATSLNNLSQSLKAQDRLPEAEPLLREALAINRKAFPEGHAYIAMTLHNLAGLLQAQGKPAEAEPMHREALDGLVAKFGHDYPVAISARISLGRTLTALRRFAEAETELLAVERTLAPATQGASAGRYRQCVEALSGLYTAWHAAEPGKGYDARAGEWSSKGK
jgi:serine/threonine protein kinase/tetratricopeptide (TPR) repeat protein